MDEKGYTNQDMASFLNNLGIKITADAFSKYKTERSKPRMEVFEGIVDVLNILEQDLFDLPPHFEKKFEKKYQNKDREVQVKNDVVAIRMIYAGAGAEALADINNGELVYIEKSLFSRFNTQNEIIAIKIIGNSMEPDMQENDLIVIEMVSNLGYKKIDGIYLVRYGDVVQIKQVQFLGNGEILLKSINSEYSPINPSKELNIAWEILGKPILKLNVEYYASLTFSKKM
jgi:phage repressor protein C with HTH and peptisase S24 domain